MFDTNGDGTLTLDEIQKIFKRGDEPLSVVGVCHRGKDRRG
jgi:hypothetical protein